MALTVKHAFISAVPDGGNTALVQPSDYNAAHTLTGAASIAQGGTNATSFTSNAINYYDGTSISSAASLTYNATASLLSGASSLWSSTNPNANANASDAVGVRIDATFDSGLLAISSPNFSNATALEITQQSNVGQNVYGGGTNAKKTLVPLNVNHTATAAGQRFVELLTGNFYGMGDAFLASHQVNYACGPGAGDEGQGFNAVSYLKQPDAIVTFTVSALPTKSTLSTTTTQAITGSQNIQTVTVTSSAGAVVGDWVIIDQAVQSGTDNIEAVQITAVAAGTISGRFVNNHSNGATVTPALLITPSSTAALGEQRLLVNTSTATTYSTGTVSAVSGAALTGSGTAWTAAIVGGTSTNIGAIALASDDCTTTPFNGTTNRLKAWYPIISVGSGTSLSVHSYSVTGDLSYKGRGVTGGATNYIIRPSARIMMIVGGVLVCETSAHTWTVGDTIECSICPWADVTGYQWNFGAYTPGGTNRSFMTIQNTGFRVFDSGILIGGGTDGTAGKDINAFNKAFSAYGSSIGLSVTGATTAGISLDASTVNASKIEWTPTAHSIQDATAGITLSAPSIGLGAADVLVSRQGANLLAMANGANAQQFRVYNSTDSNTAPVNADWLEANWSGGTMYLRTQHSGTGQSRPMTVASEGTLLLTSTGSYLQLSPSGASYYVASDAILPTNDNALNLGRAGSRFQIAYLGATTVASLPAAGATLKGARTMVTDATTTTFMGALTGGGTNNVPVFCNGTAWLIG